MVRARNSDTKISLKKYNSATGTDFTLKSLWDIFFDPPCMFSFFFFTLFSLSSCHLYLPPSDCTHLVIPSQTSGVEPVFAAPPPELGLAPDVGFCTTASLVSQGRQQRYFVAALTSWRIHKLRFFVKGYVFSWSKGYLVIMEVFC